MVIRRYPDGEARHRDLKRRVDRMRWRAEDAANPALGPLQNAFFFKITPADHTDANLPGNEL